MISIVIAPFSNNSLRDWPVAHFAAAVEQLLDRLGTELQVSLIGAPGQRLAAHEIVRDFPATRVRNDCGRLDWRAMIGRIRDAACVIGNNSGLAHLSRALGRPTVCIFGGSHQRSEWGPLGANAVILSRAIGCSSCHLYRIEECRYDAACLRDISPAEVVDATLTIMARTQGNGPVHALAEEGMR